jgi:pimeloyl-ACP methyl ester carboxylesterase
MVTELAAAPTELLGTPAGATVEYLVTGAGEPTTVFAHGLAGGIPDTRPLGSAVTGRKVFLHLRGHGRSVAPDGRWTYADLADDVRAVADHTGATRALGVSLGAASLCRLLADDPHRFERLVFFLPAVLDQPRSGPSRARIADLARAAAAPDDRPAVRVVTDEVPAAFRNTPAARAFVAARVAALRHEGMSRLLLGMVAEVATPVEAGGLDVLRRVTAPALVLATRNDPAHPLDVAERLAATLPAATLHVYDQPGVLWSHRADLRNRISDFLNG